MKYIIEIGIHDNAPELESVAFDKELLTFMRRVLKKYEKQGVVSSATREISYDKGEVKMTQETAQCSICGEDFERSTEPKQRYVSCPAHSFGETLAPPTL